MSVNDTQWGGDHYKNAKFQPWDLVEECGLGYLEGNVIKYVTRHRKKNGDEDLMKARHYVEKLIEVHETIGRNPRGSASRGVLDSYYQDNGVEDYRERIIIEMMASHWTLITLRHSIILIDALIYSVSNGEAPQP